MIDIKKNLLELRQHIKVLAKQYQRDPDHIKLLAVSKTHPTEKIKQAIAVGQTCFAESYVQEAIRKIQELSQQQLEWHFIGRIQSNKIRDIAKHFTWVHSVASLKAAQQLDHYRPDNMPPLNICIQVNVSEEASKAGIHLAELIPLAQHIKALPKLNLRGLMTIPKINHDFTQQRQPYRKLYLVQQALNLQDFNLDTLSMGMTNDIAAAIAEGATIVRVGTAIFGERIYDE